MATVEELQQQVAQLQQALQRLESRPQHSNAENATNNSTIINTVPTPDRFSFSKDDWKTWITHFERYRQATKINTASESSQINSLLLHMGAKVTKFLESHQCTETDFSTYRELKEFFDKKFTGTTNVIYARAKFNMRKQKEGETAQEYISALISLAKSCNFQTLENELIRDRLVVGIHDGKLSEALQMDSQLTLDSVVNKITQAERIKDENKELRQQSCQLDSVTKNRKPFNKTYREKGTKSYTFREEKRGKFQRKRETCIRCGTKPTHRKENCPAQNAKCRNCNLLGHFAQQCRTKKVHEVTQKETNTDTETDESTYSFDQITLVNKI